MQELIIITADIFMIQVQREPTKDFMQMKEQEDQSMLPSIFTTAIITLNPQMLLSPILPIRKVLLNPQGHIRVLL